MIGGAFSSCGASDASTSAESLSPAAEETQVEETAEAPAALAYPTAAASAARKLMTASEVYAENVNSTVGVTTSINTNYFGYRTTAAATGSGFIITPDGYVVTNYHVIEDSDSITVTMYDGTAYDAKLVGADESNDIAVLKVEAENLRPVVFGDSSQTLVGEDVIAIGNPLGELTFSLTKGVISALDREITLSTGVTMDLMQTDCAINAGNSGGALFNLYGEVIGITNAKYSGSGFSGEASIDNIGFAIPVNSVAGIVKSIMEDGTIRKPYIGISVGNVSDEMQKYGIPAGASVQSVEEGSAAEKAGLEVNDIITEANGQTIASSSDLRKIINASAVGDKLKMKVYRQGKTLEVTATIGEKEQSAEISAEDDDSASSKQGSGNRDSQNRGGYDDRNGDGNYFGFGDGGGYDNFGDLFGFGDGGSIFDWFFGSGNSGSGFSGGKNA